MSAAVGGWSTYAVLSDGTAWSWGANQHGQLGIGTRHQEPSPTKLPNISDAVEIVAGREHACLRHRDGTVSCWGNLAQGEIYPNVESRPIKVPDVVGARGIATVHADYSNGLTRRDTCALEASGSLVCWPRGGAASPAWSVRDGTEFVSGSCVRRAAARSSLECAGVFSSYLYGDCTDVRAVAIVGSSAQSGASCVVTADGRVRCHGEYVMPLVRRGHDPIEEVVGITTARDVVIVGFQGCAVLADGTVSCWGSSSAARDYLVSPTASVDDPDWSPPATVSGVRGAQKFAAVSSGLAPRHICVITAAGELACWGANDSGQIGNGAVGSTGTFVRPVTVVVPAM